MKKEERRYKKMYETSSAMISESIDEYVENVLDYDYESETDNYYYAD